MDLSKGLLSDTRPQDQPDGFYPFSKNGIAGNTKKALENEPGFLPSSASIPYRPNGVIQSDKFPIITSTDNINSAIGYFDHITDTYIPIYNDATLPFKFRFSTDFYITGEATRNYKGEVVIAITDKRPNPLYINCDNPVATTLESLYLFPRGIPPQLAIAQDQGGSLPPGAYYILAKYTRTDGTETSYLTISDVTLVKGALGTVTPVSLVISLTEVDTTYNYIQLAVLSKVNGVTKVVQLPEQPITSSTMSQVYSGAELTTDLTLEEVLVNPAVYTRVSTMGQVNDTLYIAGLAKAPEVNMQQWANVINLSWVSDLISVVPPTPEHITGARKSFMHQEVYAAYVQYSIVGGGWSKGFIIPGTVPSTADLANSTESTDFAVPRYKVEDTIHSFSTANKTGEMGVWVNDNETYPNTADFNSTGFGPDLRGQKVRHHRFPSIAWCKENLYQGDAEYGRSKLDLLGIRASNVIIPSQYQGIITGWRILYAKRTIANSTVVGQSLLMHGSRAQNSQVDADYISTGGNWGAKMDFRDTSNDKQLDLDTKTFRFHSFDMLFAQPAVVPQYLSTQLKMSRPDLATDGGLIEDYSITPDSKNGPIVYLVDYTQKGSSPTGPVPGKRLRKVTNTSYVPVNTIAGKWKNLEQETVFGGNIVGAPLLDPSEIAFSNLWVGPAYEQPDKAAQFEFTYLTNLMSLKNDVARPYGSQSLASAGQRQTGSTGDFFGGDTFLNDYAFHTYGWNDYANSGYGGELGGIKVARRFICEAVSNINLRYEIPGNIYSKWYPNSPLVPQDPNNYILSFNRKQDPNQFGYNRDLSSVNEFIFNVVYSPTQEDITEFPFRVHRLGKVSRQDKKRSWRNALPLDYYEAQKNMGFITNLASYMDRLIIHYENALFLTQGKTILESGLLGITIGSGDIFSTEPQEEQPAKLGYAGTQHDLACIETPVGYMFLDAKQGQVFIFNGKLSLINNGMNKFFQEFLRIKEKNPYMGNGFTVGYDPEYKRILLTAKNQHIPGTLKKDFQGSTQFMSTLTIGDIVFKNGRYQRYLGVNPTSYNCPQISVPVPDNKDFTISEAALRDSPLGVMSGINVLYYMLVSDTNMFYLFNGDINHDTVNELRLLGQLDYETKNLYVIDAVAVGENEVKVHFTITIHVTNVVTEAPRVNGAILYINEGTANGTNIHNVVASDPAGHALTYSITSGNELGAFTINSGTGAITVANSTLLKYNVNPVFDLTVRVDNGTQTAEAIIRIYISMVDQDPILYAPANISIPSYTLPGTVGYIAIADSNTTENLVINTISASVPGAFSVDPHTYDVVLNPGVTLVTGNVYTLGLRATDNTARSINFDLNITIDDGGAD